jgi:transposase
LYDKVGDYGWAWLGISTVLYLVFNDVMIYWIHRIEHHKSIYKYVHKRESIFNSATVGVAWMGVEWRGPSDYLTRGR